MTEDDIQALARTVGIAIDPAYVLGVTHTMQILLTQAGVLAQASLDPLVEPAPVFRP